MTIYKRIGSFILSLLLVFSMFGSTFAIQTFAATSPALSAESKTVNAGEQFTVAVSLANATTVYGGNFTLQYDSSLLTADSYEFSSIVSGHTKNCNLNYQSAGNLIRVTFSGASAVTASGTLITFTFTAKENVSSSAALQFNAYKMYDENGSSITSTATGSTITIATQPVASPTISVTSKTVTKGSTVSVPIVISDSEAVYGGNFTLQYDSNLLSADSYSFGSIVSGHTKNCNLDYQSAGNLIRVTFSGAEAISSDGTLITLTFTAKAAGTASLQFNAYKMYDENGTSIETTVANGDVVVNDSYPTSISVYSNPNKSSYYIGETLNTTGLKIQLTYSDGSTKIIDSGFSVSGFNSSSTGTKTITVYYGSLQTSFYVTVSKPSISLSVSSKTMGIGDTFTIEANTDPSGQTVTWQSSDTAVATVSNGLVTAIGEGETTITASYSYNGSTFEAQCEITVEDVNKDVVVISADTLVMSAGGSVSLFATTPSGYATNWESSNTGVAIVTTDGTVTGVSLGTATITASYILNGITYTDECIVTVGSSGTILTGRCGDEVSYTLNVDTKTLTIYGNGDMWDYCIVISDNWTTSKRRPWDSYAANVTTVTINNGVTRVGNSAFEDFVTLSKVTLPEGLKSIGVYGFWLDESLTYIKLPNSLTSIEGCAFSGTELTSITIPANVSHLGYDAIDSREYNYNITVSDTNPYFMSVDGIVYSKDGTEVVFAHYSKVPSEYSVPRGVKIIRPYAYSGCTSAKKIAIPDTVTTIGNIAFGGCAQLEEITIPNTVTSMGVDLFQDEWLLTIYGYIGSAAQSYAIDNDITFVALNGKYACSMEIYTEPTKTTYCKGESFDSTGLQLKVVYGDGTEAIVTDGFEISNFDSTYSGYRYVTVTYQGFTDTFRVDITNEQSASLSLSTTSISLNVGETKTITAATTPSGQTVTWTSSNTSVATVSGGKITAKASGFTTITAKFTYNGTTYSKTCSVTVEDVTVPPTPVSLLVSTKPTKTTYEIGESLNTSGLKLKLTYSDGTYETITSGFTTSGFSSTTAGTKTVTVKYSGLTTTFTVTVIHTHDYTSSITKKPSCTSTGVRTYTCSSCGDNYTESISATGHSWKNASCEDPKTCTKCGITSGGAIGHDYSARTTKNPSCTENGTKTYTCIECGDVYTKNIPALGHDYDSGKVTKTATCKATGVKTYTCEDCGATKTSTIAKLTTHTYSNNCDKSCNVCGKTRMVGSHKYSNSCDTSCNVCKATRTITHAYKTTTTKATLKKNGSVVKKCTVCGKLASKTTIKYAKTFKLSTTSYTYDGKVKTPSVTVKDSAGKTLKKNTDYMVFYASGRKNVGTYKVTIKMKGKYSDTKTLTFKINPAKTTIKKLTAAKRSLKVSITKKSTQVTGYEVQYSTSKKFTSAKTKTIKSYKTTSLTIKSLKAKKTYYVRVRTYKTVNGKKYYSGLSTAKSMKTK